VVSSAELQTGVLCWAADAEGLTGKRRVADALVGQNRQVLGDVVAENRAEDADVKAASVTGADSRLWG